MAVYINGAGVISPGFSQLNELIPGNSERLYCDEPDYSSFIDVKAIRRMSRIIKMGVTSSILSLKEAGLDKPDAIIVGTALGCLEDTVSFLNKLVLNKEELLNPTAFIHSTHNTISSQIALNLKCMAYNCTYVHRNISFESALIDAMLLFSESSVDTVLVGGIDELTDTSYQILKRLAYYNRSTAAEIIPAGEGSAFFTLSNKIGLSTKAELRSVECVSFTTVDEVRDRLSKMLSSANINSLDLVLSGRTDRGEPSSKPLGIYRDFATSAKVAEYKKFCGEFPTASAFGMHLAATILKSQIIPAQISIDPIAGKPINNILVHNNFKDVHHSLILLSAC